MFFKNAKSSLFILILLLLATAIWNQIYLESQNVLLNNPNWYSFRSTFVDTHATTYQISMSRIALSARELNLRTAKRSDMILNRHKAILKDLEFTFKIPNNSHLDLLYNFKAGSGAFFRLSRSSLHETGLYKIDGRGVYTKFEKINFTIDSENYYRAHLEQTDEGIVFSVDNKIVGISKNEKFENLEFGFESGMVGVLISDIKAIDVNGNSVETSLDNNSGWSTYFLKHFLILFSLCVLLSIFTGPKAVMTSLKFIALLGALWLIYDFYYYSKKAVHWDRLKNTTKFYPTPEDEIDFEVLRWHLFSSWAKLLGDKPVVQADYDKRFGKFFKNHPLNYCLNKTCSSMDEKEKQPGLDEKKKTIHLAMIGLSTTDSTGIRPGENSTFVEMHKAFYEKHSAKTNVESFNFSRPSLYFKTHRDEFIKDLTKNKVDVVVILLKIRYFTSESEILAFGDFLKKCNERGIKTLYVNDPNNPEKIVFLTQKQVGDTLKVVGENHESHNKVMNPIFNRYHQYGLSVLEPGEVFFNMKNISTGKVWWDNGHLTSYGHELFGQWIASKINAAVGM